MRLFRFLMAPFLAVGVFGIGIVADAATPQTVTSRHSMDPAFCRMLTDGARAFVAANPNSTDRLVTTLRQGLKVATDTNCYVTTEIATTRVEAAALARALGTTNALADGCWSGWPSQRYYWAGTIYVGYTFIGFSACWVTDGLVTPRWGPDCGGSFLAPYTYWKDWCGWAGPHPANPLRAGQNFHVAACMLGYCGPAYWGDQRDALYNNGVLYQYF
jgi:hypothetical protein